MYQPEKTRLISPSIGMSFPLSWAFLPGATDTTSMANIGPWTNQNARPRDLLCSGACVDPISAGGWPARWTETFHCLESMRLIEFIEMSRRGDPASPGLDVSSVSGFGDGRETRIAGSSERPLSLLVKSQE